MWKGIFGRSTEAARGALVRLLDVLAILAGLLVIVIIGWLIAKLVKTIAVRILKKIDALSESTAINNFLAKGGIKLKLSELVGTILYWLCLLVTITVAVDFLGLNIIGGLLNNLILYIPNVIISIFVLLFGVFVSTFLGTVVQAAAANVGLIKAKLMAKIIEVVVMTFAIIIALEQLKIASDIISFVVKAVVVGLAAAMALAFGFGCQDMAKKALSDWIEKIQEKK